MSDRELFTTFPLVSDTEPLNTDQFYKWLTEGDRLNPVCTHQTRHNDFFECLDAYLSQYGYSKDAHILTSESLKTLRYVFEIYQLWFTPIKSTAFHNLLRLTDEGGYYVYGKGAAGERYKLTALLRHVLGEKMGLVYPLDPRNYYFQLTGDYLFIKYQQIIGQRRLCQLTTTETGAK